MRKYQLILFIGFCTCVYGSMQSCGSASTQNKEAGSNNLAYQLDTSWPSLPKGFQLGSVTGLGIDTAENIIVFHRAGRTWPLLKPMPAEKIDQYTILVIDRLTGKLIKRWGDKLFVMPHGLRVDAENNIWVTDVGLHQVLKFDHNGKLLMKLGEEAVAGKDKAHFDMPTDVAVTDDGSFYVSDGYGNSRIIKFSADGKYLFEWGKAGDGESEFNIPHAITLDSDGNVFVADRENNRVQIFDKDGKFLQEIKEEGAGKLYSMFIDPSTGNCVTIDYVNGFIKPSGSDLTVINKEAGVLAKFGKSGNYKGPVCEYHDLVVDKEGNIYIGDILANQLQKFKKN